MKLVVKNEDGIDTAIGSSQSHCQGIDTNSNMDSQDKILEYIWTML